MTDEEKLGEFELNNIYNMDCIEGLKKLPDNSVDLVVTDPPYFLPANHYQTRKKFVRNFADLGILEHFFRDIFYELQRVVKESGHIYVFCDGQSYPLFYYHLYPYCKSVRPLIWDKKTSINGYSWRHQHELIIFCQMFDAKPVRTGDGDVLRYSAVKVAKREHPAEKPVELLKRLIEKSTKEQEIVLDPFAGAGSTLIASKESGRYFLGFEKSREYVEIANKKIQEALKDDRNNKRT